MDATDPSLPGNDSLPIVNETLIDDSPTDLLTHDGRDVAFRS
jgi:hypothetical protein